MPRVLGALLIGTLIVNLPEMLQVVFKHAETVNSPQIAYGVLIGLVVLICALIGWYLWLAYKAKPSGLLEAIRAFVEKIGRNDSENDTDGKASRSETTSNQLREVTKPS